MGKKTKKWTALLSVILFGCLLSACRKAPDDDIAQSGILAREAALQTSPDADRADEKFQGSLDLSKIHKDGYTAEGIIPAGGKTVLVAARPSGGPENTKMRLYAANTETGNVWEKFLEVGGLNLTNRLTGLCDDGTTAVVESAAGKTNIVFVNPKDMTAARVAIPCEDVWNVAVSPDKKKISYTKYDGTYLSDLAFGKVELILPRKVIDAANEQSDELPRVIGFTPDSSQLFYHNVGYEADLGYGFFNITTRSNRYLELPDMAASLFSDDKLFISKALERTPVGYVDLAETSGEVHKLDGLPKDSAIDIDTSPGSGLIGLIRLKGEETQARIYDAEGKPLFETMLDTAYASAIRVIEDQNIAVVTAQDHAGGQAEIYIWRFQ